MSEAVAIPIPPNYPVFGLDAFRTATGVHAAAIAKAHAAGSGDLADLVYSAVPASLVGRAQMIEVGPMSGRWNARHWLVAHGHIDPPETLVEELVSFGRSATGVLTETQIRTWIAQQPSSKPVG